MAAASGNAAPLGSRVVFDSTKEGSGSEKGEKTPAAVAVTRGVVEGLGDVVVATGDNEHRDLFYNVPWSHGTLAFLVSVTLRMVPAKPWVRLQYQVR